MIAFICTTYPVYVIEIVYLIAYTSLYEYISFNIFICYACIYYFHNMLLAYYMYTVVVLLRMLRIIIVVNLCPNYCINHGRNGGLSLCAIFCSVSVYFVGSNKLGIERMIRSPVHPP